MCSPAPRHALRPLHPRQPRHEERQQRHEQEASVRAEERVQARHLHRVRQEDQVWQGEVNKYFAVTLSKAKHTDTDKRQQAILMICRLCTSAESAGQCVTRSAGRRFPCPVSRLDPLREPRASPRWAAAASWRTTCRAPRPWCPPSSSTVSTSSTPAACTRSASTGSPAARRR